MDDAALGQGSACPHVDRDDHRCNSRFCLSTMEQALGVCFGAYHACPMYHEINGEIAESVAARRDPPLIMVTAHGAAVPLLATGT